MSAVHVECRYHSPQSNRLASTHMRAHTHACMQAGRYAGIRLLHHLLVDELMQPYRKCQILWFIYAVSLFQLPRRRSCERQCFREHCDPSTTCPNISKGMYMCLGWNVAPELHTCVMRRSTQAFSRSIIFFIRDISAISNAMRSSGQQPPSRRVTCRDECSARQNRNVGGPHMAMLRTALLCCSNAIELIPQSILEPRVKLT